MNTGNEEYQKSENSTSTRVKLSAIIFLFLLGAFSWQAKEYGLSNITGGSIIQSLAVSLVFSIVWLIAYALLKGRN
jgi:hypothetical protein